MKINVNKVHTQTVVSQMESLKSVLIQYRTYEDYYEKSIANVNLFFSKSSNHLRKLLIVSIFFFCVHLSKFHFSSIFTQFVLMLRKKKQFSTCVLSNCEHFILFLLEVTTFNFTHVVAKINQFLKKIMQTVMIFHMQKSCDFCIQQIVIFTNNLNLVRREKKDTCIMCDCRLSVVN